MECVVDPQLDTVVAAMPGQGVELRFTCRNDVDKVVTFKAEVEGLTGWSKASPLPVVPFESGQLRVTLTPPDDAQAVDYPLTVRLLLNGDPVEPNGVWTGVLRVGVSSKPEPVVVPISEPVPVEVPVVVPVVEPPKPASPVVLPVEKPIEKPVEPPLPKPAPREEPKPEPRVVHFEPAPDTDEEDEIADALQIASTVRFTNPAEGTVVSVHPGETALVTFSVHNDQAGIRTYVLQEDRSLAIHWIGLARDQVNVTPGGNGELALLLKPPVDAEPGGYPFTAAYGILGQNLVSCYLTLQVLPVPAVAVEAPKASASVFAPLSRAVPFELKITSAGNTDTAYRIAVTEETTDEAGQTQTSESYETANWRYVFDKELENLVSPRTGAPATAVVHRFRALRKGTWWLGWREKHKLTVRALPVTDPRNGGKPGNTITLSASRWRLLPMPAFVMVPMLAFLLVLLSSGPSDFRVKNAVQGDDGAYYVVGKPNEASQQEVRLGWNAPFFAWLKLNRLQEKANESLKASGGAASDLPRVAEYGQAELVTYEIGPKLVGGTEKLTVRFVPTRTNDKLVVSGDGVSPSTAGEEKIEGVEAPLTVRDVTVNVPRSGIAKVSFRNLTASGSSAGQTIVLWTTHGPTDFVVNDFLLSGRNQSINPGATVVAKIRAQAAASPDREEIWNLLTTDGSAQVLRIHLKVTEP